MWQAIVLGLVAGVLGGNAVPHFVAGITRRSYPNLMGNGPVPNLVSGWVGLVATGLLWHWADTAGHDGWALGAAAAGVLLIGLFHAGPGAFGRPARGERPA
ncbi:hypothetical protein [Actinomadura rugatobispora]|uniref:Uncharacterized protein n=1 Tax=Actinomadura rugatobispora TaxID=1994 RepID=A0ABW0ZTV5_9ACTN|nr:hypothetical protein GCM10010200_101620 [Actinomadura rugatobispora]